MSITRILLFAAALVLCAASAIAQQAAPAVAPPTSAIETEDAVSGAAGIEGRIRSIFAEIESLRAVQVRVSAGVVTLSGTVPRGRGCHSAE